MEIDVVMSAGANLGGLHSMVHAHEVGLCGNVLRLA